MTEPQPPTTQTPPEPEDFQMDPADIASAGRSCSALLILIAAVILVLCVGIALRWVYLS